MNETNTDGPTGGEQILWSQLAERDEVNAQLRARIAELERRVEELTEKEKRRLKLESERLFPNHTRNVERALLNAEEQLSQLRAEVERLTKEREQAKREWAEDFEVRTHLLRERDEARAALKLKAATLAGIANDLVNARAQLAECEEDRDKAFKNEIAAKCLAEAYKADLEKLNATKPVAVRTNEACICEPGAEWQTDGCPIHPLDDAARAQPEDGK